MIPTNKIRELINNSKILEFVEFQAKTSGDHPCPVYRQQTLIQIAHLVQPAPAMYFRNGIDSQPSICFSEPHIDSYYEIKNTGRCFEEVNFEGGFGTAILGNYYQAYEQKIIYTHRFVHCFVDRNDKHKAFEAMLFLCSSNGSTSDYRVGHLEYRL